MRCGRVLIWLQSVLLFLLVCQTPIQCCARTGAKKAATVTWFSSEKMRKGPSKKPYDSSEIVLTFSRWQELREKAERQTDERSFWLLN